MTSWLRGVIAAGCIVAGPALAQEYPSRPVTIIAPFAAGSGTDVIARIFAAELSTALGQQFIVDNKPGAAGTLGTGLAARAEADGYTMMIGGTSTHAASRSLMKNVPYDPVDDFAAIAALGEYPYFLLVNAQDPYTDLKSFVAAGKANPGKLSMGYGNALGQLSASVVKAQFDIDLTIVPYKSSPPALQDLMGQRISAMFNDLVAALPQVNAKTLKILAVTTATRTPLMPDVPTLEEAGMPFFSISAWSGFFVPKGTPEPIVARLNAEVVKITQREDIRKKLADMGFAVWEDHSRPFMEFVKADVVRWEDYTKKAGIEPQ